MLTLDEGRAVIGKGEDTGRGERKGDAGDMVGGQGRGVVGRRSKSQGKK